MSNGYMSNGKFNLIEILRNKHRPLHWTYLVKHYYYPIYDNVKKIGDTHKDIHKQQKTFLNTYIKNVFSEIILKQ